MSGKNVTSVVDTWGQFGAKNVGDHFPEGVPVEAVFLVEFVEFNPGTGRLTGCQFAMFLGFGGVHQVHAASLYIDGFKT